jgi:hypothetical protein
MPEDHNGQSHQCTPWAYGSHAAVESLIMVVLPVLKMQDVLLRLYHLKPGNLDLNNPRPLERHVQKIQEHQLFRACGMTRLVPQAPARALRRARTWENPCPCTVKSPSASALVRTGGDKAGAGESISGSAATRYWIGAESV